MEEAWVGGYRTRQGKFVPLEFVRAGSAEEAKKTVARQLTNISVRWSLYRRWSDSGQVVMRLDGKEYTRAMSRRYREPGQIVHEIDIAKFRLMLASFRMGIINWLDGKRYVAQIDTIQLFQGSAVVIDDIIDTRPARGKEALDPTIEAALLQVSRMIWGSTSDVLRGERLAMPEEPVAIWRRVVKLLELVIGSNNLSR